VSNRCRVTSVMSTKHDEKEVSLRNDDLVLEEVDKTTTSVFQIFLWIICFSFVDLN